MKKTLNILKYIIFLAIGIFLFSLVYREYDLKALLASLDGIKWGLIILSLVLALLSHFIRAIRWNMLIHPLGFKPKLMNTYFSVLILYATNLVIPRGGEIARCTMLSKYEKIPFGKLVGTVFIERATDTVILLLLVIVTIFSQLGVFKQFLVNNPEFGQNFGFVFTVWFWVASLTLGISGLYLIWKLRNTLKKNIIIAKVFELLHNLFEGIKSIKKLEKPWIYVGHSLLIYILYFFMMYLVLLSFAPTQHIGPLAALTAFIMGGLAMLMPVQGGIGAWHFMIIETLSIYGLDKVHGQDFALISHTSMNLMLLITGGICFILMPLYNRKRRLDIEK